MLRSVSRSVSPPILPLVPPPSETRCKIAGHDFRVRVWTIEDWNRLDESERPGHAWPLRPLGWIAIEPIEA